MSKKAKEASLKAYPQKMQSIGASWVDLNESDRMKYQAGYEQAEVDARLDIAKYKAENWCDGYDEGYKTAKINLGWRSIHNSLPEDGEYVFVRSKGEYKDGTPMLMTVARYDHEIERWVDYNDECWSADYWMPCPKIPEE